MLSRRRLCISLVGLGSLTALPANALPALPTDNLSWLTYRSRRFGTTIDYPSAFRRNPGLARSDDVSEAVAFTSGDGAAIWMLAGRNPPHHAISSLEARIRALHPVRTDHIAYSQRGADWFVLSGRRRDLTLYDRFLLSQEGQVWNGVMIRYPDWLRDIYHPIVLRIAQSLRADRGEETADDPRPSTDGTMTDL